MWHRDLGTQAAGVVIDRLGLQRISLTAKEGLAMINGTQFITAIASLATYRAQQLALQADIIAGTLHTSAAIGSKLTGGDSNDNRCDDGHARRLRPVGTCGASPWRPERGLACMSCFSVPGDQRGSVQVAARLRALLHTPEHVSELYESHKGCDRVQDPYVMRCVPQVHGIVHDTVAWVRSLLTTEMNSATDNPMILAEVRLACPCARALLC
jgi:histidine ammonia-lyase